MTMIYEPRGAAREYAALAANLYSGCAHGCVYCYAPSALFRSRGEFHAYPAPRTGALAQLEKDAPKFSGENVLLSFSTDPYQPIDDAHRLTRAAIEILHRHEIGVDILTKGGTRAARDLDLLGPRDAFAATLTFLSDADSREWEPLAALPADRIAALRMAHERGIATWASLEPVIDPEQTLEIIRQTAPFIDLYKVGKLNHRKNGTDWRSFGKEAVTLLEKLGKKYMIKEDLKKFLQ